MLYISRMHRGLPRNSPPIYSNVMQGNLFGILFVGLLAELPAILDSFFINTTSDYIGVVGKNTHQVVTPPIWTHCMVL